MVPQAAFLRGRLHHMHRIVSALLAAALLAPVALADHELFEVPDLIGYFTFAWPTPDVPLLVHADVYDWSFVGADLPPVDVVFAVDDVVVHSVRTPAFFDVHTFAFEWTPTAGLHTMTMTVDATDELAESHEDNNVMSWTFMSTHERPDLAIEELRVRTVPLGSRAILDYELCNRGSAPTSVPQASGYVPTDFTWVEVRNSGSQTWSWIAFRDASVVQPGECVAQRVDWDRDVIVGTLEFKVESPCYACGDLDLTNNVATIEARFLLAELGVPGAQAQFPLV